MVIYLSALKCNSSAFGRTVTLKFLQFHGYLFFSGYICYDSIIFGKKDILIFMNAITLIIIYLVVINCTSFITMGVDKYKARKRTWRIPESTLFVLALIGGSIGSIMGMHLFHHKTRHWYFLYGMPAILIVQILLVLLIVTSPIEILVM